METSTAETIVKVYAVLAWLSALFAIFGALVLLGLGSFGGLATMMGGADAVSGGFFAGFAMIFGIIMIIIAVFDIIVGYGLWTRQPWARIATIVMSVLSIFSFPIGTIIGAIGIWLFGFEETVKGLFVAAPAKAVKK